MKKFSFLLLLPLMLSVWSKEIFVCPRGTPGAKGTRQAPLDLITVLSGKGIQPGDTIWLLSGTYNAPEKEGKRLPFVSQLQGTTEAPIIVRALPGEKVRIDGWMEVKGQCTWFWGFEVADSTYIEKTKEGVKGHGTSITVFAPGSKFINLDVHDGAQGFGFWAPAVDSEIYGCLIHDFSYWTRDRGHGHAIYTQNEEGTKRIVDNIIFRGFGWNIHAYGQAGKLNGFHIEGNIISSAGTRVQGQVTDNILVCGYQPADRITLIDNYCYHPGGEAEKGARWRPCARLSNYKNLLNGVCFVKGNVIMGARGLQVGRWKKATIVENLIWGPEVIASIQLGKEDSFSNYQWNRNTYFSTGQEAPFIVAGVKGYPEQYRGISFQKWKELTGFDSDTRVVSSDKPHPTGTWVFIRPNKYEKGRLHIAVYNSDKRKKVSLDLSKFLNNGAKYEIYNVQTLYERPVVRGIFEGEPITVRTLRSEIAPQFEAYLLLSR